MRALFADTHNVVEGAGAASLAAVLQERTKLRGLTVGIVLTGANVDPEPFARILAAKP
jgi:threonine dehydratase